MNEYFTVRKRCPSCESAKGAELCRTPYTASPVRDYLISFYSPQGGVEFDYLENQDYTIIECDQCGLIYQSEIPNDFLMHKLYEEWIDPEKCFDLHEKQRSIRSFAHLSAEIVSIVTMFDRPPMDLKFLDYSMGWGNWCRIAQSFGCLVHGTEFSQSRIKYAGDTGVCVIDYNDIGNNKYDFINTEQVFEHLPDIKETLVYLARSLKADGILKISVPNGWDIKRRLKTWDWNAPKLSPNSLNAVAPLEHINCFSRSSLVKLAEGCGLVPIGPSKHPSIVERPSGMKQTVKAVLRPYWQKLKGIRMPPSTQGTYICFRLIA